MEVFLAKPREFVSEAEARRAKHQGMVRVVRESDAKQRISDLESTLEYILDFIGAYVHRMEDSQGKNLLGVDFNLNVFRDVLHPERRYRADSSNPDV
jgi:hypothetical protein